MPHAPLPLTAEPELNPSPSPGTLTDQVAQKKTNARFAATREQGGTLPAGSKGKVRPWPYPYPYP